MNPLAPGHLFPYEDRRPPTVDRVVFRDLSDHRLDRTVSGTVTVVAQAHDEPSMPVPAPWSGMPVTPARLRWSIEAGDGRTLVGPIVAVDFTRHLPLPRDFWRVYAPGTYQNFPVVGGRYFFGTRGRYLFRLVSLDTRTFANGSYRLDVAAATSAETSAR